MIVDAPLEALLVRVNCPLAAPALAGLNVAVKVIDCPGLMVTGKLDAEIEKALPVSDCALTETAAAPVDVRVIDCVAVEPTARLPKATLVVLTPSPTAAAWACTATVFAT